MTPATSQCRNGPFNAPITYHHAATGRHGDTGRFKLGHHTAGCIGGIGGAGHLHNTVGQCCDLSNMSGTGVLARVRRIKPVDIRQQDQQICTDHCRHAGGQPVIVTEADFCSCHRVILIDHRHGTK